MHTTASYACTILVMYAVGTSRAILSIWDVSTSRLSCVVSVSSWVRLRTRYLSLMVSDRLLPKFERWAEPTIWYSTIPYRRAAVLPTNRSDATCKHPHLLNTWCPTPICNSRPCLLLPTERSTARCYLFPRSRQRTSLHLLQRQNRSSGTL